MAGGDLTSHPAAASGWKPPIDPDDEIPWPVSALWLL